MWCRSGRSTSAGSADSKNSGRATCSGSKRSRRIGKLAIHRPRQSAKRARPIHSGHLTGRVCPDVFNPIRRRNNMTATQTIHAVVSYEEWLQARKALLDQEKALTRQRDELSRKRRELPWVKVEKDYMFDGPQGSVTLSDLFA